MKVFITGSKGQLGSDCLRVLKGKHELRGMDLPELDITDALAVEKKLAAFAPDVIVNCAAYTKVDDCETDRAGAMKVNADGPRLLADYARRQHVRLIHISTDYVFDGRRAPPQPYREDDSTGPVSYYGVTKLEGEKTVLQRSSEAAIVRTARLYGIDGNNFLKAVLRQAVRHPSKSLRVVNDQHGCPTWSYRLALQLDKLIDAGGAGVYHAVGLGHCTWYELAKYFLGRMGVEREVVPCASAEYPRPAQRPQNSILENRRLKEEGILVMVPWRQDVDEFTAQYRERLMQEAAR